MNCSKLTIILVFGFFLLLNVAAYTQGNVGIGTNVPVNKLDVAGGLAVGAGYAGVNPAPVNGALFQGAVGIGKDNPAALLDVNGDAFINGLTIGRGQGNKTTNTIFGFGAFAANIDGQFNTAIGSYALNKSTTGMDNIAMGHNVLFNNTSGKLNTAAGTYALYVNTTGLGNTAFGKNALYSNVSGSNNTALGYGADVLSGDLTNAIAIGFGAKVAASNSMVLGGTGVDAVNVGIGTNAPINKLDVSGGMAVGTDYAGVKTAPVNGALFQGTVGIGTENPTALLDVSGDALINGLTVGRGSGNQDENVALGLNVLLLNTAGQWNTALGSASLLRNTTGNDNTATGYSALYGNYSGNNNTGSGTYALFNTHTGSGNSGFGKNALYNNTTGSNNTALGTFADVNAGNLTNATAIGYNAKVSSSNSMVLGGTGGDAVNVGIGITAPVNKLDVAGGLAVGSGYAGVNTAPANGALFQGRVGIGTTTPSQALDVNGLIRMRTGAGAGYIPVSDANGVMTWTSPYAVSTGIYSSKAVVTTEGFFGAAVNGWNTVPGTAIAAPGPGQYLVFVSLRCKVQNGSGTDNADFRVLASSGCAADVTANTGIIQTLDEARNNYGLITFQRMLTLTGNCQHTIQLQIDMSYCDDSVYYDDVNISYLRVE